MAGVSFDQVSKIYPDGTRAVDRIELEVNDSKSWCSSGHRAAARRRRCAWWRASRTSPKGVQSAIVS